MSRPLILFSGGTESTALLTIMPENAILATLNRSYDGTFESYNKNSVERIAEYYDKKISYFKLTMPQTAPDMAQHHVIHQMWYFVLSCTAWVKGDTSITEVWCGRNLAEPSADYKDFIDEMMALWDQLNPTVKFLHPLDHLTKQEQWNLIPTDIKPLVSTCTFHKSCGTCPKCLEFSRLVKQ